MPSKRYRKIIRIVNTLPDNSEGAHLAQLFVGTVAK